MIRPLHHQLNNNQGEQKQPLKPINLWSSIVRWNWAQGQDQNIKPLDIKKLNIRLPPNPFWRPVAIEVDNYDTYTSCHFTFASLLPAHQQTIRSYISIEGVFTARWPLICSSTPINANGDGVPKQYRLAEKTCQSGGRLDTVVVTLLPREVVVVPQQHWWFFFWQSSEMI